VDKQENVRIPIKSNPMDIVVVFILCNFDAGSIKKLGEFEVLVKLQH
jgi:hypothetical protein